MPGSFEQRGISPWDEQQRQLLPAPVPNALSPEPLQGPRGNDRVPFHGKDLDVPLQNHVPFQQPLHRPMPISPRSRQAGKPSHQKQQQQQSGKPEQLSPFSRVGSARMNKLHHIGYLQSRSSSNHKGDHTALPGIGYAPLASAAEEGGNEAALGLGTKLNLECKGSLAAHVLEHPGEGLITAKDIEEASLLSSSMGLAHIEEEQTLLEKTHPSELEARRKALALVAFVRHSTADLQAIAKLAAARTKPIPLPNLPSVQQAPMSTSSISPHPTACHPNKHEQQQQQQQQHTKAQRLPFTERTVFSPQLETWSHTTHLPGCLYAFSPEVQGSVGLAQWPPQLPVTPEGSSPPHYPTSSQLHLPPIAPATPDQTVNNLNGIGHPVLNRDAKAATALLEAHQANEDAHSGLGKKVVASRNHGCNKGKHASSLQGLPISHEDDLEGFVPKYTSPSEIRKLVAMESNHVRGGARVLMSKETLPKVRQPSIYKTPAYSSKLELWGGKRLNETERKIDSQLHQIHVNATAKAELMERVNGYILSNQNKAAEHAALTLFANERREQRTITFLQRQAQLSPNKAGAASNAAQHQQRLRSVHKERAALFHLITGEPVADPNPLPQASAPHWHGLIFLMMQVKKLGGHVHSERYRRMAKQHQAARTIQAAWRGYRCREPLTKMRQLANQQEQDVATPVTEQHAADLLYRFLLDRMETNRKEAAVAAMRATAARARAGKSKADMLRGIRTVIMMKQWDKVEASAIEVSQRRTRGNATLGVVDNSHEKASRADRSVMSDYLAARKKGDMPNLAYTEEQKDVAIKEATSVALNYTFATDKIINENWKPVPEAVKVAILNIYLSLKSDAYIRLIGLVWQARARFKAAKRELNQLAAAKDVLARQKTLEDAQDSSPALSKTGSRGPSPEPGPQENMTERSNSVLDGLPGRSSVPVDKDICEGSELSPRHFHGSKPAAPSRESSSPSFEAAPAPQAAIPDPASGAAKHVHLNHDDDPAGAGAGEQQQSGSHARHSKSGQGSRKQGVDHGGSDNESEGEGPHKLKFTMSARRRQLAQQKSRRRSSMGFQARGRSRVEHSLDVNVLLQEGRGPPMLPPPKAALTLMEMKAVMQQGVAETPMYNGYMLKGSMEEHERKMTREISRAFYASDRKTKRSLVKAHARVQGDLQRGTLHILHRHESLRGSQLELQPDMQAANSWTLALLSARWHAECFPRALACLQKRLHLLRVDLVDCLLHGKVSPPEEMGQILQQLVLKP